MFELIVNAELAAVLLYCLEAGEHSISQEEYKDGRGALLLHNIANARKMVSNGLATELIKQHSPKYEG